MTLNTAVTVVVHAQRETDYSDSSKHILIVDYCAWAASTVL